MGYYTFHLTALLNLLAKNDLLLLFPYFLKWIKAQKEFLKQKSCKVSGKSFLGHEAAKQGHDIK